ncbi:MAG: Hsp20/alpha crystallin family protein [Sandaracinaceae bacterium]|nr:Hsp20/alpha crystallin family protein [Sandaracinaceae bacterium]MCC6875633.1 Hsp20/alpha crystallin family protein [Sandaracinaceae bacterium]
MLTRWDPFAEMSRLQDNLNRTWGEPRMVFQPSVDIFEEPEAIVLKAEVPGMKSEDVHVHVENNVLTLRGERKLEHEEKKEGYHRIERAYGSFSRSFALPKSVDAENIAAELKDGVLTLRLPKRAAPEKRRIEIRG